jgi:hypothetical protein
MGVLSSRYDTMPVQMNLKIDFLNHESSPFTPGTSVNLKAINVQYIKLP